MNYPSQKIITVCDKCLTEICLKGQFPCAERLTGNAGHITDTEENVGRQAISKIETESEAAQ